MPIELISAGPPTLIQQNVEYSLPSVKCQLSAEDVVQFSATPTSSGGSYSNLSGSNVEPGVEVTGGFIKCTTGNINVVVKKYALDKSISSTSAPVVTYASKVIADGASNYWRLGEISGTIAIDSVGGKNGIISGGVTLNQDGALADGDKAMAFNGTTGQIVTTANVAIPLTVTCEAWVKTAGLAGQPSPIFHEGNNSPLFCLQAGGAVTLYDNSNALAVANGNVPLNGAWHHLVFVLNGSTFTSYTDGVSNGTVAAIRTIPGSAPARLGWSSDNGTFWHGSLDEVAIYPVALTPAQIANHYALRLDAARL